MIEDVTLNFPSLTLLTSILNSVDYRYGVDTIITPTSQTSNLQSLNLDLPLTFTPDQSFDDN